MVEKTPEAIFEGFVTAFDQDVEDMHTTGHSGRSRVAFRARILESMKMSGFKLDLMMQISLFELFSDELVKMKEYGLAEECFSHILDTLVPALSVGPECSQIYKTTCKTRTLYNQVDTTFIQQIGSSSYSRIAPVAVTKLLVCLQDLRVALKGVFEELPAASDQEQVAWLILNGCKLILKVGQPLAWLSCGKYVTESIIFAALCMESVVNLCTTKHLKFRMKLYTTALYTTLAAGSNDDSQRVLSKIEQGLAELRDREEVDAPVPEKTEVVLLAAEIDAGVMRAVLHFWANPDELGSDVIDDESALKEKFSCPAVNNDYKSAHMHKFGSLFQERVLSEYIRVHQLTSGNQNETYRRRTAALLRGFYRLSKEFPTREVEVPRVRITVPSNNDDVEEEAAAAGGDVEAEPEAPQTTTVVDCPFSKMTLLELFCVSLFEELPEGTDPEDCPINEIQAKILEFAATATGASAIEENATALSSTLAGGAALQKIVAGAGTDFESLFANENAGVVELSILQQLMSVVDAGKQDNYTNQLLQSLALVGGVDKVLFSSVAERRQAFLRNLSITLWKRSIYPLLQRALSDITSDSLVALKASVPALVGALRTLDLTRLEDPLLLGSLGLVVGRISGYFGDYRGAIALLLQALASLDEHRAARVDIAMHQPVDSRDVRAIQRGSFTVKAEAEDWFHGVKRLGAHAFAGFGIFGLSSQSDRTDCALAEVHADLTAMYFRFELEYAIERRQTKRAMKSKLWTKDGRRTKWAPSRKNAPGSPGGSITEGSMSLEGSNTMEAGKTGRFGAESTMLVFNEEGLGAVVKAATDQLTVVPMLEAYCERNVYARALLYTEMARVEKSPEKQVRLLTKACNFVEEAELEEEKIKDSFSNLNFLRKNVHLAAPIVIARSHRCIYVVPVGSLTLQEKKDIHYYRVYGKEERNGSAVTLVNDELDGGEKRVSVNVINTDQQICDCAVRVGKLRWGQKYVFAAHGFDEHDHPCGNLSTSTTEVAALNPLPTVMLWANVFRCAKELNIGSIRAETAGHICDRFFLSDPNQGAESISVGKGTNLLVGEVPAVCMLVVQQSSTVILACFVDAFLALLDDELQLVLGTAQAHLNFYNKGVPQDMRRKEQWKILSLLRRTATATIVATYTRQTDLVVRCVAKAYEQAVRLLFYDECHMSGDLQNLLIILVVALQSVPKRHWHELEHKLYCRLLCHVLKLAIANRSTASVVPLLNHIFDDADTGMLSSGVANEVSAYAQKHYLALEQVLRREAALFGEGAPAAIQKFNDVFAALIAPPAEGGPELPWFNPDQGFLWRVETSSAVHAVLQNGPEAVLGDTATDVQLSGMPETMSSLLRVFVSLVKTDTDDAEADRSSFTSALDVLPIYDSLLHPDVLEVHQQWKLSLVREMPELPEEPEVEAEAALADGEEVTAADNSQPLKDKVGPMHKYQHCSAEERNEQFCALAEIAFLRAQRFVAGTDLSKRQYFPENGNGPEKDVDTEDLAAFITPEEPAEPEEGADPATFGRIDYVVHMGAAVQLFAGGRSPAAAVHVAVRLWNFIMDSWVSPDAFAAEFATVSPNLKKLLSALIDSMCFLVSSCGPDGDRTYELQWTLADLGDSDPGNAIAAAAKKEESTIADESVTPFVVREHMTAVQNICMFLIKVVWLHRQLVDVIELGSRVMDCYLAVNDPAICKRVGECFTPVISRAQGLIIEGVESEVADQKKRGEDCVAAFAAFIAKKRRKKTRTTRVDKDEDDIRHESEMEVIDRAVADAESRLEFNKQRDHLLKLQRKRFNTLYPTGIQLFNKVQIARQGLLNDCYAAFGSSRGEADEAQFSSLVQEHAHLTQLLDEVLDQYDQVANFLREKKDKVSLIRALNDQGDLLLLFGMNEQARSIWNDGLDGLFNAMDACRSWHDISNKALHDMNHDPQVEMLTGFMTAINILGKLSMFCAAVDWDTRTDYCRFAAEICRAPFLESYGHPVTRVGFAAYVCKDLGGIASFIFGSDQALNSALAASLEEVVRVLHQNHLYVQALPPVVMLEYLHSNFTHRADLWLSARMLRVRLLIDARLFAQAASMLATIQYSVTAVAKHSYMDLLAGAGPVLASGLDTAENGLDFHGLAPFFNHLPPDNERNAAALVWIAEHSTKTHEFLKSFTATTSRIIPAEENSGEPTTETIESPLFQPHLKSELSLVCALFLVEIGLLDGRMTTEHSGFLKEQGDKGVAIITAVAESEINGDAVDDQSFPYTRWIQLYSDCIIMRARVHTKRREFMEARRLLVALLEYLRTSNVTTYVSTAAKSAITYVWLQTRDMLMDIALRQYRMEDAVKLGTIAMQEASQTCNGFWVRSLLLRRAVCHYRCGRIAECLLDCDNVMGQYDNALMSDISQLRCISLKAGAMRDALTGNVPIEHPDGSYGALEDSAAMDKIVSTMRTAYGIAETLCMEMGFLGADVNVTFNKSDTQVSKHHYLPPLLHSLTVIHPNDPKITVKYSAKVTPNNKGKPNYYRTKQQLRAGPIDVTEQMLSQSEYANVYLREVRVLADCHAALAAALDEKREVEAFDSRGDLDESMEENKDGGDASSGKGAILTDQTNIGENALKLLRHVVFASSHSRNALLQSVGRSRVAGDQLVGLKSEQDKIAPFVRAIEVARASAHDWSSMRMACIRLVEYYYAKATGFNPSGGGDAKVSSKALLAKATSYAQCCIQLGNQLRTLEKEGIRTLSADKAFSGTAPPAEMAQVLDASTLCSSAGEGSMRSRRGGASSAPPDPKAKGKGGAVADPPSTSTARDAIYLLSSLMRDFEGSWLGTDDRDDYCDLDTLLKSNYPTYSDKCKLPAVLSPEEAGKEVSSPTDSISSLWVSVKTTDEFPAERLQGNFGRFSHVAGYFVLGGDSPVLRRVVAQRADVVHVRKGLLKLRNNVAFALANPGAEGNLLSGCADMFVKILELLNICFRDGYIDEKNNNVGNRKPKCEIVGEGADTCVKISVTTARASDDAAAATVCSVPMNDAVIGAMSDTLCCDKDMEAIVQPEVHALMSALLK